MLKLSQIACKTAIYSLKITSHFRLCTNTDFVAKERSSLVNTIKVMLPLAFLAVLVN